MSVTSAPIGSTGQSLDGFGVDANVLQAFRESVVITDPSNSTGAAPVNSTYGLTVNVASTVASSTQIVSSIPFFVAQSSAPWSIIGGVNVSSQSAVSSSWPLSTTLVNIVSSIPLGGGTQYAENAATTVATGNVSMWMAGAAESTVAAVASSTPMPVYELGAAATNIQATSIVLIATLNTTVIKAGPGVLYGYQISNFASTSLYVKFANASSAVIASTAKFLVRAGASPSTSVFAGLDVGANFSTGITIFTTRNAWDQDLTAPLGSTAVVNIQYV